MFILRRELTVECGVCFYLKTLPCLSAASRSRTTLLVSSKNCCDSMWLEFITSPVNIRLSNAASISRQRSFVATRVLATNVHETSFQLQFCTRESRDPRHHGLSVSNGKARTLSTTKFFELLDAFVVATRNTPSDSRGSLNAPHAPILALSCDFLRPIIIVLYYTDISIPPMSLFIFIVLICLVTVNTLSVARVKTSQKQAL